MPIHKNVEYRIPTRLLGTENAKTSKGLKKGITTYIMYLAPAKQNNFDVDLCTHASNGCRAACLFQSGSARFTGVQLGRINKTNYFIADPKSFMKQLVKEIQSAVNLHNNMQDNVQYKANGDVKRFREFVIRLNGSSDVKFEEIILENGLNIFETFPNIQFYDYTKDDKRMFAEMPKNYHLTFSRAESNHKASLKVLANGGNVAVVFGVNKSESFPSTFMGYKVISGDETDLRYLDPKNVIVGLTYKKVSTKGGKEINDNKFDSGFVIDVASLTEKELA